MNENVSAKRCCQDVMNAVGGLVRCARYASVIEDGRDYCKQHAPSAVRKRREASEVAALRKSEINGLQSERRFLESQAFARIANGRGINAELAAQIRECSEKLKELTRKIARTGDKK